LIRLGTKDDIPELARLGRLFFNESGYAVIADYDEQSVRDSLTAFMDAGICVLVVAEEDEIIGMTGAVISPLYLNRSVQMAQELFWWVHPDHRGGVGKDLLNMLEAELEKRGAAANVMIALQKVNPELTGKLYERRGYQLIEHHYMRLF
jgi:ribosomal protein S18 acetylase RimI-like enzyme